MADYNLDKSLIEFVGSSGRSCWTIRDAFSGTCVWGSTGAGKTSSSGAMIAKKFLSNQFGGLVLCTKVEERDLWENYCSQTNRLQDLIVVEPKGKHFFNFLEYESSYTNKGSSITANLVHVLKTVIKASADKEGGRSDDQFWESALDMLLHCTIDLCVLAQGSVSIEDMYNIVITAPKNGESSDNGQGEDKRGDFAKAFETAQAKIIFRIEQWKSTLSEDELRLLEDDAIFEYEVKAAIPEARVLSFIDQFFAESYRNVSSKTRSIIDFSFVGFLFHLLQEPFYSLFCNGKSTFTPESCLDGKIILLNLPVKQYDKVGRDIQIMYKFIFQRAMERRDVLSNGRPVFIFCDEAHTFIHEYDADYQATARSSRIATVYLSQNLANFHANMRSDKSEHRITSLTGNLALKIFHGNTDIQTNRYASDLIGEAYVPDRSESLSGGPNNFNFSQGKSYKLEKLVRPEEFVRLKTGGPFNNYQVEAYVHRQGQPFQNGENYDKIVFPQHIQ